MNQIKKYLTEAKLVAIMEELYGKDKVRTQVPYGRKRADIVLSLPFDTCPIPKIDASIEGAMVGWDDYTEDGHPINVPETVDIQIEFDGHYHYTKNSKVIKEHTGLKWHQEGLTEYILRIPYWVQPDAELMNFLFGVNKDFSDGYPHGFIDSKCVLPDVFTTMGDLRFLREMDNLPKNIALQVYESLVAKAKKCNEPLAVTSIMVWDVLVEKHDSIRGQLYQRIKNLEKSTDDFYEHLSSSDLNFLKEDFLLRGII